MYRHEKTFINPTILAVIIDCSKTGLQNKINRINKFEIKGVNKTLKADLIILKNAEKKIIKSPLTPTISIEALMNLKIKSIVDNNFKTTSETLITTRKKAIIEKDDKYSDPVCVWMEDENLYSTCAKASYYICKYANMIVFKEFDEAMFSTLIRLRENIFTDPQKPLQVEPGLYEFKNPTKNSIVFLTTNFALTYFAVANELENLDTPSYLIVIPADGMSVLTAWSAEKFTANIVKKTLDELSIREKLNTRKIIIPGLLAGMTEELKEASPDFDFIVGTHEASAIREFVKDLQ